MSRITLLLLLSVGTASAGDRDTHIEPSTLPASGAHRAEVTVSSYGRFAILAESKTGVAIELVDRMAGPRESDGEAGVRDGRIDLFLDGGAYRLLTAGHERAEGDVTLRVRPFDERSPDVPRQLVEHRLIESQLEDFERVSYWLELPERKAVILEAAGRSLSDLRLWREGRWLVDATPATEVVQPVVGQPLLVCRLATTLEPGLYRLSAYGGPSQPWAEASAAQPLYVRYGIPRLPEAGRRRLVVSPFGYDRWRLPGGATFYRLELPEARPAELRVEPFRVEAPFAAGGNAVAITKQTVPPAVETHTQESGDDRLVTVTAAAGQPYVLQHFHLAERYVFERGGPHWLATVHAGHAGDSIDATTIVARRPRGDDWERRPYLEQTIHLGATDTWRRRFNLLETTSLQLKIETAGAYEVAFRELAGEVRVEPFMLRPPERYEPPEFRAGTSIWDLDPGFYVLTVRPQPKQQGIVELAVRRKSPVNLLWDLVGAAAAATPLQAATRFARVELDGDHVYELHLNTQPGVTAGVVLRPLPLELGDGLPLVLGPQESIEAPFRVAEASVIRADGEDGSALDVSVDRGPWHGAHTVAAGEHAVGVRNTAESTRIGTLLAVPPSQLGDSPLPELPLARLDALPEFPLLTETTPRFFDLERGASATFLVRAERAGLYRLETTGLLATEGNVRTRTTISLDRQEENGVGRNFLVERYLRAGDYQVTVTARGRSAGHVGLHLTRTELRSGGTLRQGVPARITLPVGTAAVYGFDIADAEAVYQLRAMGVDQTLDGRLEDADGWPLMAPGSPLDLTRRFAPGSYRVVVLPRPAAARVVTHLALMPTPRAVAGHGPHELALGETVHHTWHEPDEGADRVPDVWDLTLPAAAHVTIRLTEEMHGQLRHATGDEGWQDAAYIPPVRGWSGELAAGRYRLEATCVRRNNRVLYELEAAPRELLAGYDRPVRAPAAVPLALGAEAEVELASFGAADVRARLVDPSGRTVASGDDRDDDWNFLIAGRLAAGSYRLLVDPVGRDWAETTVAMRVVRETPHPPIVPPATLELHPGDEVHVLPIAGSHAGAVLLVAASSAEAIVIAAEEATDGGAQLGSERGTAPWLAVPLGPTAVRIRTWSVDRRGNVLRLQAAVIEPPVYTERQLAGGVRLRPSGATEPPIAVAELRLDGAGGFRPAHELAELRWSDRVGAELHASADGLLLPVADRMWVAAPVTARRATLQAARLSLADGRPLTVTPRGVAALDLGLQRSGPVLVQATATAGQPVVRLARRGDDAQARADAATMAFAERSAVAIELAHRTAPLALVWRGDGASAEATNIRLRQLSYDEPVARPLGWAALSAVLAPLGATRLTLPAGNKRLRLTLGPGVAAVLGGDDGPASTHWGDARGLDQSLVTEHTQLTLLSTVDAEAAYGVETIRRAGGVEAPFLSDDAAFEQIFAHTGTVRLALPPGGTARVLHVRGAVDEALLLTADGTVARGRDLELKPAAAAWLWLRHRTGLVLAWPTGAAGDPTAAWGTESGGILHDLLPPAEVALGGRGRAYRLELNEPVMLHMRTEAPVVTRLDRGRGRVEVEVHEAGCTLDAYLPPAGPIALAVRAIGDRELSGTAQITTTAIPTIGEGLGPEILLPPGATRAFAFAVASEGPVGVGVRAASGAVETVLYDPAGDRLGTGVVQMPTLAPGTYVLAIRAPADGPPVRARPALAGLERPGTGPPEELVRSYMNMAGAVELPEGGER